MLLAIGQWLQVNGEAIYGTRCWKKYGEGNTSGTAGSFSDNDATAYTAQDIRFTTKGNDLYAITLNWSDKGILIKSLDKKAIGDARLLDVKLLGSSEPVKWEQTEQGLLLTPPQTKPCDYAYAFKLSFDSPVGSSLPSEMVDVPFTHGN